MILLRSLLGDALRRQRQHQGRTLREVSAAARVSLGYLSEVERGQKEASSELLGAICTALDVPLSRGARRGQRLGGSGRGGRRPGGSGAGAGARGSGRWSPPMTVTNRAA
jgi:transcriptional regulator with XRE-family HTH domain